MRDFKCSPRCNSVSRSGGLLRSVYEFVYDISGQRIGPYPTFKLSVQEFFYSSKLRSQPYLRNYPDERRLQVSIAAGWSEIEIGRSITNTALSIVRIVWCR